MNRSHILAPDYQVEGTTRPSAGQRLIVRSAREGDLDGIEKMIDEFVRGHPAEKHARSRSSLREAYFGEVAVANLVVAENQRAVVGMAQWTRMYDMFWSMYGGNVDWLYVRPEERGRGAVVALVAEICAQVRRAGGEFLHGGGNDEVERLYERAAVGRPTNECHLSAEAFQVFADLAGLAPREMIRRLPSIELNRLPPRRRP